MYHILFYEVVDNYINLRASFREEHLKLAQEASHRGQLILAGAFANPPDGAALIFKTDDIKIIEDFVRKDPYVQNGLIKKWYIRQWTVVIGNE